MADYPTSLKIENTTNISVRDGLEIDFAEDLTVYQRDTPAEPLYDIQVVHEYMTYSEVQTLMTFYATNRLLEFTFYYGPLTFTAKFAARPQVQHVKGGWWRADVSILGTQDDPEWA